MPFRPGFGSSLSSVAALLVPAILQFECDLHSEIYFWYL